MSADQDSNIEQTIKSVLPPDLLAKTRFLAGEFAWSADDTLQVIALLSALGQPIVGVELWQEEEGMPKWIATSSYNYDKNNKQYVSLCAKGAEDFVRRFRSEAGAVFNLS